METIPLPGGIVRFGTFELDVRTGELRKRGYRIALQEQPLRILLALLDRPGEIVSREELCSQLWPHGTFVDFEHSLNAAVRRLRVALGDDAGVPRFVETIHKRGYRFLALNTLPLSMDRQAASSAPFAHLVRTRARLAVLPCGPCDGFTEGLTDEAMTQLTQACPQHIGVLARASVERARRNGGSAAEIGSVLGADYLVEGQVRRDGERVRVTAQLIESQQETHLWARTFERLIVDTLSVQTEIAGEIARAVADALSVTGRASA